MTPRTAEHTKSICRQHAQRREPSSGPSGIPRSARTSLARLAIVTTVVLLIGGAPRAQTAWPAPGDVLVLTSSFDGARFHGHVFAVDPVTLVKTRVVDFDTFFEPEIYLASSNLHIIPDGIAGAPDGSIWAFYHATFTTAGGALLRINANGTHRLFTIASPSLHPSGMAFAAGGEAIVVTNNNNLAGLFRVDPTTGDMKRFVLNNSDIDPDCNPNTNICLPIAFREAYGVAVDPVTGHIIVGDVEGGAKATPSGTDCQQLADCGAVYVVVPGAEFLVTDPNNPLFGQTVVSGTKTLLSDFGDPAHGPIGNDAGLRVALASDGTILVTDPALQTAGGKLGALFRVQANGMHDVVTRFDDPSKGQPGESNISGPFPVAITGDETVLIGACDGNVAASLAPGLAICAVDDVGVRSLWSDFGVTIPIDGVNRPLFGARALAIQALNRAPVASVTAPATAAVGAGCLASVTLDGSASIDPNGDVLTYEWSEGGAVFATSVTPTVSLALGAHTITLTVTDPAGAFDSRTVTVTVTSDVTLAYLGPGLLQSSGSNIVQARASTPNGPVAGATLAITVNGNPFPAITDATGLARVDVGPVGGNSATVRIAATSGACANPTTVTVPVNRWPLANWTSSAPNVADQSCTAAVTLDASASSDPDGDALTFRWTEGATTLSTQKVATVTLGADVHAITFTVDDGRGGSASRTATVLVQGEPVTLEYTGPVQLTVGVSTPVSARLRTAAGAPIAGATVAFLINGFSNAAITDASGVAAANVTPPAVGPTMVDISSTAARCYQGASISTPVTVLAQAATLVVAKTVINDDGGKAAPADFTITVSGVDPAPASFPGNAAGTTVSLNAGVYSVSEVNLPGYDATLSAGCNGTIALGETRTCTIVNNDRPATLRLTKNVSNDNGGTAPPSAWTLTANGTTFPSGVPQQVAAGDYLLAESGGPSGYTAGAWSCIGGTLVGNTVTVSATATVACSIVNDDQPAQLTLTKVVVNDNGGAATPDNWTLTAGVLQFVSGVPRSINAGVYALAESGGPGGYAPGSWSCAGGALAGSTLTLQPGQTAACTITNDDQPATLTVIKHVVNDQGGTRQAADFTLTVTGISPSPGRFPGSEVGTVVAIAAGVYTVTESGPVGYTASFSADCAGSIAIGENKICTITNDDRASTLTLTKSVLNDNGGAAPPTAWTLSANGAAFATSVAQEVVPGEYTLAESGGPSGYTPGPWICAGGTIVGNTVTVPPTTSVLCSIVNDDQPAQLTLVKRVVKDNGGTANEGDWLLTANGLPFQSGVTSSVNAGTYALLESGGPPGYTASAWFCAGGMQAGASLTLANGESATCTIVNDDIPATLTLNAFVINNDGGRAGPGEWMLTANGIPFINGVSAMVDAGSYTLAEAGGPAGYTAGPWSCVGGQQAGAVVVLALGDVVSCSITNDDDSLAKAPVAYEQTLFTPEDTALGLALTATDANGDALSYSIVTGPAHGVLSGAAPNLTYTPSADYNGPDGFTFRANDGMLDSAVAAITITVSPLNDPPVAANLSATTPEDTAKAITLASSDIDSPSLAVAVITGPMHGSFALVGSTLTYTPAANYSGPDSFTFTANDGTLNSNTATVSIVVTPVNDLPSALNDVATTALRTPVSIAVLGNDVDPDGDQLSVTAVGSPANGTAVRNADNTITYTPRNNFSGTDVFTYAVTDGQGATAAATVSVTVQGGNVAPKAGRDNVTTPRNTSIVIFVLANDVDANGDALSLVSAGQPADGTAVANADGSITYTPNAGFRGQERFTYVISDGKGGTDVGEVQVRVR